MITIFGTVLSFTNMMQNMYVATLVATGSGVGIAVSTGDFTQIGTINRLVNQTETVKTDVLRQIDQISKVLFVAICCMSLTTFFVAFFYSETYDGDALISVNIALTCAVAMVPEGLEAIVTLTYSYAVKVMASQNAIVRALPAVETLGSVTVICSDKTGTLTQNIMSLTAFVTSNARYKNNVDASERVPTNFVRDDTYLAERAKQTLKKAGAKSWLMDPTTRRAVVDTIPPFTSPLIVFTPPDCQIPSFPVQSIFLSRMEHPLRWNGSNLLFLAEYYARSVCWERMADARGRSVTPPSFLFLELLSSLVST